MIYEGQICRGPMERSSFMLPVAVGCSYNRCRFCNLFKHLKYRQLPMEQVEEEILRVQALGGDPETVFLGDGNAFGLETGRLLEIAGKIRRSFPSCRSINMDATVTNIRLKSDEELRALAAAGLPVYAICIWALKAAWTTFWGPWKRTTPWNRPMSRSSGCVLRGLFMTPIS